MTALDDQILDLMRRVSERAILPRYRNLAAGEVVQSRATSKRAASTQ